MMAEQKKQAQSIFPDMPRETPAIDKDGNFTHLWDSGFSSLFQALQKNYKNEGIIIPPLTDANMATIQALYASYIGGTYDALTLNLPDISGQTVFDSTTKITNQFVIATDAATPPNVTIAKWVPLSVLLTNAGNPNGTVSGMLNWLCYDTAGMHLYICTASGSSTTTIWLQI